MFRSQAAPYTTIFAFRGTSSFLDILDDRNQTVHVYSQEDIQEIYAHITAKYVQAFGALIEKIEA